jgi:hypothetical protein
MMAVVDMTGRYIGVGSVVVVPEAQTFAFSPYSFLFRLQGERI